MQRCRFQTFEGEEGLASYVFGGGRRADVYGCKVGVLAGDESGA